MSKIAKIIVSGMMALMLLVGVTAPVFVSSGYAYAEDEEEEEGTPSGGGTSVSKAEEGVGKINSGSKTDLMGIIKLILNTVFVIIGILAVVFIIMGGINYTMSQGDPGKVKKAKDTILYGIIGLIVSLAAFAIVQFVLDSLK